MNSEAMNTDTSQRAPAKGWLERFDRHAGAFFERHEVPGAAVVAIHRGEVVYRGSFGMRDLASAEPVTPDTRFGIASLTKSFTALTLLALEAKGALSLDDPVTRHLPAFAYPGLALREPVRLWHLASHTSGLPPVRALDFAMHPSQAGDPIERFNRRRYEGAPRIDDADALLAYLEAAEQYGERPALAEPGAVVSYSNEGYALLGTVIERVTGLPLEQAMRREVFDPLGMAGATFDLGRASASGRLTELYTRVPASSGAEDAGRVIASPRWEEAPAYLGTGLLRASADDLARALAYLASGGDERLPIAPDRLRTLWRGRGWAGPGNDYALGWTVRPDYNGVHLIRHGGSLKGVSSHQGWVPELGVAVAILTNLDEVPVSRLFTAAVNAAMGMPIERPTYDPADAVPAPEALAGTFASGEPWGRLELRWQADEGALHAWPGEEPTDAGRVVMLDDSEFLVVGEEGAWDGGRFHLDAEGRATAVQYGLRWYDRESGATDGATDGSADGSANGFASGSA